MRRALERLGRLSVRYRWLVIAGWLGGTVACVILLPSLSSVVDTQNSAFLPAHQPSVQAGKLETPFQASGASQALLVASNQGRALTPADQAAVTAAEEALEGVPRVVVPVRDLATSVDGKVRLASVDAKVPMSGTAADDEVAALRAVLSRHGFGGVEVPASLTFNLTGPLATSADNAAANASSQARTEGLTYLIIIVILLLVYRSALGPLVNLVPAGIVLALSEPVIGGLAKAGLPVSSVTPVMMTVLVLGAGTDYGLFLILRFKEELGRGVEPRRAVAEALGHVGESVVYAGLTVAGALFCLILSSFGIYRGLGPSLALAILLMLLASVTLTPALLAVFGRHAFWPAQVVVVPRRDGLWSRVAERCAGRPGLTMGVGVIVLVVLALGVVGLRTTGFSGGSSSPAGADSARGTAIVDASFPPSVTNPTDLVFAFPTSVWTSPGGLDRLAAAEQEVAGSARVKEVNGPFDPVGLQITVAQLTELHQALGSPNQLPAAPPPDLSPELSRVYSMYRSVAQYVSGDGKTVQFAVTLPSGAPTSAGSVAAVPGLRELVSSVAARAGATESGVYGLAPFSYDVKALANHDLLEIFPIVALVIAILLALLLRSLVAPVFLLLSVALSYGSTLGFTNLVFVHLGGQPGINFVLPFLLFVFLVALGEDYNILVMSRIREECVACGVHPDSVRISVVRAVGATGTTVTSAGIILAGTFAAVAIGGQSSQMAEIGVALAFGILLDTFVVRTLLVPSMVQLLGRMTWWPSSLGRVERREPSRRQQTPVGAAAR